MHTGLLPLSWRLLLALALVAGPLPSLASVGAPAPPEPPATSMPPCHGDAAAPAAPADGAACEDHCCPSPTCDASQCRLAVTMPAAIHLPAAVRVVDAGGGAVTRGHGPAPPGEHLRPPIG